jgi:hypothetical protein
MKRALLVIAGASMLGGCNPFFFLPPLKEGKHYVQLTTATDVSRGLEVAACLQRWAQSNGYPSADYSDVTFQDLVIVGVGDPGVVGSYGRATFEVAGRENGDSIFVSLRDLNTTRGIAIKRHEDVHIVQQHHRELIGADGNIHWSPPFDYCRIPIAIFTS